MPFTPQDKLATSSLALDDTHFMQEILDRLGKPDYAQCPIQYGSSRGGNLERLFQNARLTALTYADGEGALIDDIKLYNVSGGGPVDAIEIVYEDDSERALIVRMIHSERVNYWLSASSDSFASLLIMRV